MYKATFPTCRDQNASTAASVIAPEFVHQRSPGLAMGMSLRKHQCGIIDVALVIIALAATVAAFMLLNEAAEVYKRKPVPELQTLS
jgi:hypothetical protein